jgi:hypothetical protein
LSLESCWASGSRSIVGSFLDRFLLEPIEPVADRFPDDSVAVGVELVGLLERDLAGQTRYHPYDVCR